MKPTSHGLTRVNKSTHLHDSYHGHYPIKAQTNITCTNVLFVRMSIYVQRWLDKNNCYILFYITVHGHNYKNTHRNKGLLLSMFSKACSRKSRDIYLHHSTACRESIRPITHILLVRHYSALKSSSKEFWKIFYWTLTFCTMYYYYLQNKLTRK